MKNRNSKFFERAASAFVFAVVSVFAFAFSVSFGADSGTGILMANVIGTIASGVGTPTQIPGYKSIPNFLVWEIATTPQRITVTINGRFTAVDLDTAGINALANARVIGKVANSFILPLSNGLITDLTMDVRVVNGVATAFDLLAINKDSAPEDVPGIYAHGFAGLNAGSTNVYNDFAYFVAPSMAATDFITYNQRKRFSNGALTGGVASWRNEPAGIRALLSQRETQAVSAKLGIDNFNNEYDEIIFVPQAAQTVYVTRLVSADFKGQVQLG